MSMMIDIQQHYPHIIRRHFILITFTARNAPDHLPSAPIPRSAQYDWLILNVLRVTIMVTKIRGDWSSLNWCLQYKYANQGAGKRPAAQEKQIVRASPEGRCPRPEGPRAAEQASRCSSFFFFFFFFYSVHYIKM